MNTKWFLGAGFGGCLGIVVTLSSTFLDSSRPAASFQDLGVVLGLLIVASVLWIGAMTTGD